MSKRDFLTLGSLVFIAAFLSSCTKDPLDHLNAEESRIYVTNYDSSARFTNYKTFSIVDSAAVISNDRLEGKVQTAYDLQIINAVKAAMQQRGFTLVSKTAQPDLGINVSRISNTYTGVVSYPNYWDYYGSYYDPYYWGYGGYGYYAPSYYGLYQVNEAGLSVDMLDLKNATTNGNKIRTVWSALARGTGVFLDANAASEVGAFFSQSPYLKATN
ncbi:MAG: DUF4136 domain-containing protein [Williamsia sp.]|nr:DUF4136 domain-containing protein [Williamsia sp.]